MSYRVVAALAAAAIVIATAAVIAATHHTTTSLVNANQDQTLKAYQKMMVADYNAMNSSTSDHCNTITDTACPAAVARVVNALQHWLSDLETYQTPARYVILDGELRAHLQAVIAEFNAGLAAQTANNSALFDIAFGAAQYERGWLDPTSYELWGHYATGATTFADAVSTARKSLGDCVGNTPVLDEGGCAAIFRGTACSASGDALNCQVDAQLAATTLQTWLISLVDNPAPAAQASAARQVQADIAHADSALLAIDDGLSRGDSAKVAQARGDFVTALNAMHTDLSAL